MVKNQNKVIQIENHGHVCRTLISSFEELATLDSEVMQTVQVDGIKGTEPYDMYS